MEKENKIVDNIKNKKIIKISLILFIFLVIAFVTIYIFYKLCNEEKNGNTIGNIRNFGYVAEDKTYIYYMSPDKNGKLKAINRIDKNLDKDSEQLIAGDWDITGINVYKNYIYFITLQVTGNNEDLVNNQIHKMKIDGSEHNIINNNDFHNSCYEIYVIKDKVYYIGEDECIYTMNLDGSEKSKFNDKATGFIGITDKYILYNVIEGEEKNIVTHIMNLDGNNDKILTGDRLYAADIIDNYIYYVDSEGHIYRVKIGESKFEMLSSITSYCVNTTPDGVYSLKYIDKDLTQQAIFRMNLDGSNEEIIKKLDSTSSFLAVTDEWIIYMDESETEGIIAMVSKDGKKYQELYSLNFEKYLEN